jgi:hypothetical protein
LQDKCLWEANVAVYIGRWLKDKLDDELDDANNMRAKARHQEQITEYLPTHRQRILGQYSHLLPKDVGTAAQL